MKKLTTLDLVNFIKEKRQFAKDVCNSLLSKPDVTLDDIYVENLKNFDLRGLDLKGVTFRKNRGKPLEKIVSVDFSGSDLSYVKFYCVEMVNCNFSNCDLSGTGFDCLLVDCNFSGAFGSCGEIPERFSKGKCTTIGWGELEQVK